MSLILDPPDLELVARLLLRPALRAPFTLPELARLDQLLDSMESGVATITHDSDGGHE